MGDFVVKWFVLWLERFLKILVNVLQNLRENSVELRANLIARSFFGGSDAHAGLRIAIIGQESLLPVFFGHGSALHNDLETF